MTREKRREKKEENKSPVRSLIIPAADPLANLAPHSPLPTPLLFCYDYQRVPPLVKADGKQREWGVGNREQGKRQNKYQVTGNK